MKKAVILMLIVFSLIIPLTEALQAVRDSEVNRSNRTLLGSAYGVEGRIERTPEPVASAYGVEGDIERTPEPVETPEPTSAPEPTNTPEPTSPPSPDYPYDQQSLWERFVAWIKNLLGNPG